MASYRASASGNVGAPRPCDRSRAGAPDAVRRAGRFASRLLERDDLNGPDDDAVNLLCGDRVDVLLPPPAAYADPPDRSP